MNRIVALSILLLTLRLEAQEDSPDAENQKNNLEWAIGLAGRFRQLHDPVVATYALSQLGGLVCAHDREAGAGLFRESLVRLRSLTPASFTSARHRLPIPSFTSMWNYLTPKAVKCAPELNELIDPERAKAKMQEEKQQANDDVRTAYSVLDLDSNPDRAAQLVETALSVSDPSLLDIPTVTLFLSHLRDKAPDVSDDLFPQVLDFIATNNQPSSGLLLELGKYLFTAPRYVEGQDILQQSDVRQVGSASIANFMANRRSSSSDDIHDYIDAALKVLTATNDPYYDPVAAFAVGYQMLSKVDDFAPEDAEKLRNVVPQIEQQAGASASQVQNAVAGTAMADPEGGEGARLQNRIVRQVFGMLDSRHFPEARGMVQKIDDPSTGSQVRTLIDFGETAAAIERKDAQWAFTLSNPIRGGMKRALLYAGMTASARDPGEALSYLGLGIHDTELLPAEQRMVTTVALMNAILGRDLENGILALSLFAGAANDAYTNPHKGRFEPDVVRKVYSKTATAFTDSALILASRRCLCEVVDTGRGRHTFGLKVPGVETATMTGAIAKLSLVDAQRLEGILAGIRDENLMSSQLNILAALRLKS
jgi:hypothetical protein